MFGKSRSGLRRSRRLGRRGFRRASKLRSSRLWPILKISAIFAAAAALVVVIIFVLVPLFSGKMAAPVVVSSTPSATQPPIATGNLSENVVELAEITPKSINDPYVFGTEVVFSTGDYAETSPTLNAIAVYDMNSKQTANVSGITKKYDGLYEPKINDKYMVYLDCKAQNGGAVCGYDRSTSTQFVMREYFYGKPKITLSGDYALWLQQTLNGTDKLYLYYLPAKECATIEVFVNTAFFISAPYMSLDSIIYVQPDGESQVLEGSSASSTAQICIIPIKDKGDAGKLFDIPGTYVYEPMIKGDNVVFLDSVRDSNSKLMYCKVKADAATQPSDALTEPVEIAQGVLNYFIGDGFVAYTKDDAVYVYYFADGSTGKLSSEVTKGLLSSVNEKNVIWYDTTEGFSDLADVIRYIQLP